MNGIVPIGSVDQKMSSREIAGLMEKEHKNVLRDIKSLIEQGAINALSFELVVYKDAKGENRPEYLLDFDATMTLITGYDAKRRAMVIKRWRELETGTATPAFQLPATYAEALRALADESEKSAALQKKIDIAQPKAEALDRIALADGNHCITNSAKILQVPPKVLFALLQAKQWIYRRVGGRSWVAYQGKIQQGLLTHKVTTVTDIHTGNERVVEQVLVTPKGLAKLSTMLVRQAA